MIVGTTVMKKDVVSIFFPYKTTLLKKLLSGHTSEQFWETYQKLENLERNEYT